MYVDELIGPDTVNTMPDATIAAFLDHGKVERTIDRDLDLAHRQLAQLEELGISLKQMTDELTVEGVASFSTELRLSGSRHQRQTRTTRLW